MPPATDVCDVESVNQALVRRAQKQMPAPATLAQVVEIFSTLGDPTRAKIVCALSKTELCVCDLAALLGMTISAVSHQLRILRHTGLVKYRKTGRLAYYSLDDAHASELLAQALEHARHAHPAGSKKSVR